MRWRISCVPQGEDVVARRATVLPSAARMRSDRNANRTQRRLERIRENEGRL
jgi:hypothetical protein